MGIVEFLTKNYIYVLGALFVIYKIFFGGSSQKTTQQPTFGGGTREVTSRDETYSSDDDDYDYDDDEDKPSLEEQRRQEEHQRAEKRLREEQLLQREEELRAHQQLRYEQQMRIANAEKRTQQLKNKSPDNSLEAKHHDWSDVKSNSGPKIALSQNELRRAIIWSEILGQPRAKRPHRK